jgi:peptidoglycan/LPS O-acetylase OafA/YrhL
VPHAESGPYVTGSQSVVPDGAAALRLFTSPDHDPRKQVVLERADLAGKHLAPLQPGDPQIGRFTATRTNNSIQVQVTSDRPGWLVLPTNYDQGWSAEVGGVDVPVARADYSRMAVQVPAGSSAVVVKYRPRGFFAGLGLLMIAVLISAIVFLPGVVRGSHQLPDLLRGRPSVRRRLGGRSNSFGLLRLVLASIVLITHAFPITGRGEDPMWVWTGGQESFAGIAVGGFFAISGYLVARSAMSGRTIRFAWFRALRILPAFWACLAVTAFLVGPVLWLVDGRVLGEYFSLGHDSPFGYLHQNFTLAIHQYGIRDLLQATTPYGRTTELSILDGSLWTLVYEVRCYIVVAALLAIGMLSRRRVVVPLLAAGLWLAQLLHQVLPGVAAHLPLGLADNQAVWLTLVFMTGASIALYADALPMNDWLGASAAVVWLGTLFMGGYQLVGLVVLPYLVLWLAARLPIWFHRVGAVNDYSYGIYIYGFLAEQLLARFGASSWPLVVFLVAAGAASFAPAWLSWHLLEKHALRLKHWGPGGDGNVFTYDILALIRRNRAATRAIAPSQPVPDTSE